jgi:hypothetical protein
MKRIENSYYFITEDGKVWSERSKLFLKPGITHKKLTKLFNVDRSVIGDIINRKTWKHVD